MSDPKNKIGGTIEIPGHEKTIGTLEKIVAEYQAASFDSVGKYNFSKTRQDAAITPIMELSQFYTRGDAIQMLSRAVTSPPRPARPPKKPRSSPKPP